MQLKSYPRDYLPSAQDLPDSDETPVDNELQDLIPTLLKAMLASIWSERMDWFFGVDMGVYTDPNQPAIVPDGFLSIGVPRIIDEGLRLSYVLWEEQQVPTLVLEVVSKTPRGEYVEKKQKYAQLGVLYYVIYNPLRKKKQKLEVYQLEGGKYQLLSGEPIGLSQLNLGIGRDRGTYQGITREWLYWYDENGDRYPTPEERAESAERELETERQEKELERDRADRAELDLQQLREKLKQLNIDPDALL
ncbi:MAG: Uma2 family endonuclease [Roseofilum sp. SBFL]|uniref:Uma2 family endonuclease n=1 Tax=unclassified Roseofilum TaxID=2620099 RepID=UPI001B1CA70E|nr:MULTISPECIES: Uma2 family endonuclease [unclassified Roseofilum]MBP0012874.1 Uma2 family endonuclease [Roseofilum sp. SID3]MBP0025534.1 Uma2 family endonuclease [Roseofilum sp. SID2]MBP0037969.1 Uma2 family endonuclease [Roseofilum sp. SID1]MBP0041617.1 Uma2 family endonuclease [Roseofilum sp. SBFL]